MNTLPLQAPQSIKIAGRFHNCFIAVRCTQRNHRLHFKTGHDGGDDDADGCAVSLRPKPQQGGNDGGGRERTQARTRVGFSGMMAMMMMTMTTIMVMMMIMIIIKKLMMIIIITIIINETTLNKLPGRGRRR